VARRRIELPSADELFGDVPATPRAVVPKKAKAKAAKPKAKSAKPKTAPKVAKAPAPKAAKKPAPPKAKKATAARKQPATRRRSANPEARLAAIEARLSALPVDALIDLRDNLEDLLAADTVDVDAVTRLLDSVEV